MLSPKEVDWETVSAEQYYDDFDAMIQWINRQPTAVYLNALHWKQGVLELIPRMDHYVVYVSSLTESALWELDQLHTDQRRGRVTVVFDEDAIGKKASAGTPGSIGGAVGRSHLGEAGGPPSLTAQVREGLTKVFKVMDPDEFEANIDDVKRRIDDAMPRSNLGNGRPGSTSGYPAVRTAISSVYVRCRRRWPNLRPADRADRLPAAHVAQLQLRIHLTLLLGDHAATSRALAAYSAVMQSASDHYAPTGERAGALSEENRPRLLAILANHGGLLSTQAVDYWPPDAVTNSWTNPNRRIQPGTRSSTRPGRPSIRSSRVAKESPSERS